LSNTSFYESYIRALTLQVTIALADGLLMTEGQDTEAEEALVP
jgi:hypothetical protein